MTVARRSRAQLNTNTGGHVLLIPAWPNLTIVTETSGKFAFETVWKRAADWRNICLSPSLREHLQPVPEIREKNCVPLKDTSSATAALQYANSALSSELTSIQQPSEVTRDPTRPTLNLPNLIQPTEATTQITTLPGHQTAQQ